MEDAIKLGIIICDRYRSCAGGKCLRALRNREGAFERYGGREIELVGFTSLQWVSRRKYRVCAAGDEEQWCGDYPPCYRFDRRLSSLPEDSLFFPVY